MNQVLQGRRKILRKLISRLDSVSDVSKSGMAMLENISPKCCIFPAVPVQMYG